MIHVPDIAHRRVAVTHVNGMRRRNDPFRRSGLTADHQVIACQIELLESQRHEREIGFIQAARARERIDKCRNDLVSPDTV